MDDTTFDRQSNMLKTIAAHLLQQGGRAVEGWGGRCVYRNSKGQKCAVGVLILDEAYNPAFEQGTLKGFFQGHDVSDEESKRRAYLLKDALLASGVQEEDFRLLDACQDVHDSYYNREHGTWDDYIKSEFRRLADIFGLDPKVIPA